MLILDVAAWPVMIIPFVVIALAIGAIIALIIAAIRMAKNNREKNWEKEWRANKENESKDNVEE
jgi:predicted membrane protein